MKTYLNHFTPLIIKKELGEEVYNIMERAAIEYHLRHYKDEQKIVIYTSEAGYDIWMDALKEYMKNQ